MLIDINELKQLLLPLSDQIRAKIAKPLKPVAEAHYTAHLKILGLIFNWISETQEKGELDMNKLMKSLSVEIVKISEIPHTKKDSHWQPLVKEEVASLKPGQAKLIDPSVIKYGHLNSVIVKLKREKEIDDSVRLIKRGAKYYLAKMEA